MPWWVVEALRSPASSGSFIHVGRSMRGRRSEEVWKQLVRRGVPSSGGTWLGIGWFASVVGVLLVTLLSGSVQERP